MKLFFALISVGVLIGDGLAAEKRLAWPQFRGPNGSGVAEGQKPSRGVRPGEEREVESARPGWPFLADRVFDLRDEGTGRH